MNNFLSKLFVTTSVVALSTGAIAADTTDAVRQKLSNFDWSGIYGGVVGSVGLFTGGTPGDSGGGYFDTELSDWGAAIGLTGGINFQNGHYVYGLEGDISWSNLGHDPTETFDDGSSFMISNESEWKTLATLRARAGLALDRTLAYVTGGIAIVDVEQISVCSPASTLCDYYDFDNNGWDVGVASGAGVEHAFNDSTSVKLEYLYLGLPTNTEKNFRASDNDAAGYNFRSNAHLIRAGVNHRFGASSSSDDTYDASHGYMNAAPHDWSGTYWGVVGAGGIYTGQSPAYYQGNYYDFEASEWGGTLGLTAGINFQDGNLVYGLEGDFSFAHLENGPYTADEFGTDDHEAKGQWDWLATVRARAGLTVDDTLFYVTGGVALVDVDQWYCYDAGSCGGGSLDGDRDFHNDGWKLGFTAGAGVERAITNNLSHKLEYLYVGLPTDSVMSDFARDEGHEPSNFKSEAHLVRAGLNYRFGDRDSNANHGYGGMYVPMSTHEWEGFYAGLVGAGGIFTGGTPAYYEDNRNTAEITEWGGAFGATAGVNFQDGSFVYGIEGDFSWSGLSNDEFVHEDDGDHYESESAWNWLATLRARVGLSAGNTLAYATAGLALAEVDQRQCYDAGACGAGSYDGYYDFYNEGWQFGIAAGAGVEHAIEENTSVKFEYLYVGLPSKEVDSDWTDASSDHDAVSFKSEAHLLRAGVNRKF